MPKRSSVYCLVLLIMLATLLMVGCSKKEEPQPLPPKQTVKPTTPAPKPEPTPSPVVEVPVINQPVLSTQRIGWGIGRNSTHTSPGVPAAWTNLLSRYQGYYLGDTSSKILYLTFDEGYENGFTPAILDTLKQEQVSAAFFVTNPYIKQHADLVQRMVKEGHLVGNHTSTHPSMAALTAAQIQKELGDTAASFRAATGQDISPYMRPPMGEFSEHSLAETVKLGYKSIFWSFAYKDYDVKAQPGKDAAYQMVMKNVHPGAILLLHAVSQSNTEALPNILRDLKAQGYTFLPLTALK
ncbi:MAG: delta-lactam-biosynthetic de-N-acetylase [Methylocystaceae bacterium]